MKVFIENFLPDSAIYRISDALRRYVPGSYEIVEGSHNADHIVLLVYGHKRRMNYYIQDLLKQGKTYSMVQLSVRSTSNPLTTDWLPIWEKAKLVWSYYNLIDFCREDGNKMNFNFYYAPLGVDTRVFKETSGNKSFVIASTGSGKPWNKECKNELVGVAKKLNRSVFQLGNGIDSENIKYSNGMDDETLAKYYSQCEFVSGLRRIEGFELPILEGLVCGARPLTFDRPHYKHWFSEIAEFIPEDAEASKRSENIYKALSKGAKPVGSREKDFVKRNFNWKTICEGFWQNI